VTGRWMPSFLNDGITVEDFRIDGKAVPWNDPANALASWNFRGSTVTR